MFFFTPLILISSVLAALLCSATAQQPVCTTTQFAQDDCQFAADGECDVNLFCGVGTDCIDCDPCRAFDATSCAMCASTNGCNWCASDGICVSTEAVAMIAQNPRFFCDADGFTDDAASCAADSAANFFDDPLFAANNWIYELINVVPVWKSGITGAGISIRVNDDGVAADHPDFSAKFDVASSCPGAYLPVVAPFNNTHGTTCAAIAAASANDACSTGIAPDASVSSCLVFPDGTVSPEFYYFPPAGGKMDVSSNSYGTAGCMKPPPEQRRLQQGSCPFSSSNDFSPCLSSACTSTDWSASSIEDEACREEISSYCENPSNFETDLMGCQEFLDLFVDECFYNTLTEEERVGLVRGVTEGRDGKGIIHVTASGNTFDAGDDTNFAGFQQSRFTITVGAVGKFGKHASYSTPGASIFLSAPGGDSEFGSNHLVALATGGCYDAGVGTSFATPVVTGVVALMLQVNAELGWRDVQGILAVTSQKTDPTDPSWSTNAVGLHHSPKYGFGLVDALEAVDVSSGWVNFSPERMILKESGLVEIPIRDDASISSSSTINVDAAGTIVESVVVYLNVSHATRGDLSVLLTSPSGTESLLVPGNRPETSQGLQNWKLLTVRAWGESPVGDWTISIVDVNPGDISKCQGQAWSIPDDPGGEDVFCSDLELFGLCGNETTAPFFEEELSTLLDANGSPAAESAVVSCCACGGGDLAENVKDVLHSWKLVIYGHDDPSSQILTPSQAPNKATPGVPDVGVPQTSTPTTSASNSYGIHQGVVFVTMAAWFAVYQIFG